MPTALALSLISLVGLLAVVAVSILCHSVWVSSTPYRRGWRLRLPLYNLHATGQTEEQLQPFGDFSALVSNAATNQPYRLSEDDRQYIRERHNWYESQRGNPAQYIDIQFWYVDCQSLKEATPTIKLVFWVHNSHGADLIVTSLDNGGLRASSKTMPGGSMVRLPTPRLGTPWRLGPGTGSSFEIEIDVRGVEIASLSFKDAVLNAKTRCDTVKWELSGTWRGEVYGQSREIRSGQLESVAVPVSAQN